MLQQKIPLSILAAAQYFQVTLPIDMNHEILSSSGSGITKKVHETQSWNITV